MRNNLDRLISGTDQKTPEADPPKLSTTQELNFIVPTELVDLPSKGKFYPQHHPLHNKDTIEIRQMTAKEEDILSSKSLLKKGVVLDKLIQSLVVDKNINTDSLLVEDRSAIIISARISAYGSDYATLITCPSCEKKTKYSFDLLEKLEESEKRETIEVDENGLFTVVLPKTGWTVKCRAMNGYDEKEILRLSQAKTKSSDSDALIVEQLKMIVVSINGVTDKDILFKAVETLPAKDSKHIRTVYQDTLKGIDMRHTFKCGGCEYEGELEVPLTADFFWFK